MKTRAELDEIVELLRAREAAGEVLDPQTEALQLRRSGLSVVETGAILAKALGLRLADVQELLVRLAASGEDRSH
jgi:hypothetical protein